LMDGGKVVLHLDLIAGLPHETYARFVRSFNEETIVVAVPLSPVKITNVFSFRCNNHQLFLIH
ncbi:hypothetical protein, partial [Bacteroides sp. 51]|uniref:hypothetical protein n=1 Tax=Bacteroides sp. 51 TaxID=2302938 RepID=UPI0013D097CF